MKMAQSTRATLRVACVTAPASRSGPTEPNMRETGATTKPMEQENSGTQMAMSMTDSGKRTKPTVMEYILTSMEPNTRDIGATTSRMAQE